MLPGSLHRSLLLAWTAGFSLALLLVGPSCAAAETLTYGPFLSRGVTPDSMIVRWGTAGMADPTTVKVRRKGETVFAMQAGAPARDHEIVLRGLQPSTVYEYAVESGTVLSPAYGFATCPAIGDNLPLDLVFYGDSRDGASAHARLLGEIRKRAPDMVFESGDIAPRGRYAEYLGEFFPATRNLFASVPFLPAPGNHDADSPYRDNYGAIFPSPRPEGAPWRSYYSVACGRSVFIALDSNSVSDKDQNDFLLKTLGQARQSPDVTHVFVWFHHAAYSPGSHGDAREVITRWVPLFNDPANKVTAVFGGHDHVYARMRDPKSEVLYIVSGGAGAPLYSDSQSSRAVKVVSKSAFNFVSLRVVDRTVSGVAYSDVGVEIDRFTWTKLGGDPPPADMGTDAGPSQDPDRMDPLTGGGEGGCSFLGRGLGARAQRASTPLVLGVSLLALLCAAFFRRRPRKH
jgi:3',5'-cyclic AMP phosphodiesterase CpdA